MLKRKRKIIAKVMATTMLTTTLATSLGTNVNALEPRNTVSSSTIAGNNRYETAVKISENGWTSATNAVLINGDNGLVDALTATPYANLKNAPILVTHKDSLTPVTKQRLISMGVKNVDIVGGNAVVSENVVSELKSMNISVNRIAGTSRYKTAVKVAEAMDNISDISKIAVVNGATGLPDAVSVAAPAAANKMPILLSNPNTGIEDSKAFIDGNNISKSYVIGDVGVVSNTIMNSLPGTKVRLGGARRQETNAKVIQEFYPSKSLNNIYIAKSGQVNKADELVDALSVGVLAAKKDAPVLLVGKTLDSSQENLLRSKTFTQITQVGGGIPSSVINDIKNTQADPESRVTSVSMIDYKTVKIIGSELNRLNSSNISMTGNTVKSYNTNSTGTEATVEFNNAFDNGTNTVKITSNLGNVSTFTFTYNSEISSVEATTSVIKDSGIQYAEFTINGGKKTIEELNNLGWSVEFVSNSDVFYSPSGNLTSKISSTGKLKTSFNDGEVFSYEVILTKDNKTIKSGYKSVEVKSDINNYKEIKSYDVILKNGVKINSGTSASLVVGESATISNVKASDNNNNIVDIQPTFSSSNPEVVSINKDSGELMVNQANKSATITMKSGDLIKTFVINTKSDIRKVSSATVSKNTVNLVKNGSSTINEQVVVTFKDQYQDPYKGSDFEIPNEISNSLGSKIANVVLKGMNGINTQTTNDEGKLILDIEPLSIGSAVLSIKHDTKDIGKVSVNVSNDSNVKKYSLELPPEKDTKLNVYEATGIDSDKILTLKLNKYNSNNYLIGTEKNITLYKKGTTSTIPPTPTSGIWVKLTDENIADIYVNNGEIEITAKKSGTTSVQVFNGDNKNPISSVSISVEDTTPIITDIDLNSISIINEVGTTSFDVKSLLDTTKIGSKTIVSGISLKGTSEEVLLGNVKVDGSKKLVLFVDRDIKKDGQYIESSGDLLLATIDVSTDFNASINDGETVNLSKGDKGNIIIKIYNGAYDLSSNPFIIKTINVDL